MSLDQERELLRSVALQNASSVMRARLRAEEELIATREELRRSNERLRATFEQAAVGIAIADLGGYFLETNAKFSALTGYDPDELRRLTFREITFPEDLEATSACVSRLVAGEIPEYAIEKRYRRRDGTIFWSFTTVTLMRGSDGRPERFIGVVEDITARIEAQEAFRRSEQFSRRIVESSSDCVKTLDLDGIITWISDSGCRTLCATSADVVGRSWVDFWNPEDRAAARDAVREASAGRVGRFNGVLPIQGEPRWWNVAITPILDAQGRPESLLAVSRDETLRVEREGHARDREQELRQLANSIPQLAWMAEPDGKIFWFNQRWFAYTGSTPEQMLGWGWKAAHDPQILPAVEERWRHSLRTGEPFEMEFPLRAADGRFRWFLTRVEPLRDPHGRVTRWFGTNTDIDDVRAIRKALEEETRMLEILNQSGQVLASSLDLQSLLQKVTDSATTLSGAQFGAFFYNVTNPAGESYMLYTLSGAPREAFDKFGQPRNTPVFAPTFAGKGIIRSDDITRDPHFGTMAPHHGMPKGHLPVRSYLAVPVISRSGEVLGGLFFGHSQRGVFGERTERLVAGIAGQAAIAMDNARLFEQSRRAAAEREELLESERHARADAERANRMKDEFLATLSHELRTPLSSILGWSHLLRSKHVAPDEAAKGLEIIERNARLQTQLIDDLLDMSRITSGKLRLDVQPVQPIGFVEAALETVRPAADAKGVSLLCALDPEAGPVSGDPARLQQVAWNLLNNAIKFTGRGGKVQVVLERVNSQIELRVADTGVGIEAQFLEHVFDRFRQADASTTRRFGGLGLGLSIVKQLVELHGGHVMAHSGGRDRGATFIVRLPLSLAHRIPSQEPRSHPRGPAVAAQDFASVDLKGLRILVVDDEPDSCALASRVLRECGAQVSTALGGVEALRLLQQGRFDVLVSDVGMPQMDGYELIRQVRALAPEAGGRIPAVAMTAFARSEDRTRSLRAGFQVHIAKPVEPSELTATVASAAGRIVPQDAP